MCELWSCAQFRVTVLRPSQALQLAWLDDQMNLTVGNLSSEQDRLSTTVTMILLLKYEAPACLNFISKTTTAFCVRVFCHATVLLHHFFLHCHSMTQRFKTVTCVLGGGAPVCRPSCIDCWVWQVVMGLECYAQITWKHNGKKKRKEKKKRTHCGFDFWVTTVKTRRWTSVPCDLSDLWLPNRKKVSPFQVLYLLY